MILYPFADHLRAAEGAFRSWAPTAVRRGYYDGSAHPWRLPSPSEATTVAVPLPVWVALVALVAVTSITALGALVPSGRTLEQPGRVQSAQQALGLRAAGPTDVHLVTARVRPASWWDVARVTLLRGSGDLVEAPELPAGSERVAPRSTGAAERQESVAEARVVAARAAGLEPRVRSDGLEVWQLLERGGPAGRAGLRPGDVIRDVGGTRVDTVEDAVAQLDVAVARSGVDGGVELGLAGGRTVRIEWRMPATTGVSAYERLVEGIGAYIGERDLTVEGAGSEVRDPGTFDGGSAGLALALAHYLDGLPERRQPPVTAVAATGFLRFDGSVLMVGSIGAKARAVARSGVPVFLVPVGAGAEARAAAPRLQVVEVASFDAALPYVSG